MDGSKNAMYAQAGRSHSWSKVQPVSPEAQSSFMPPMYQPPIVELPDIEAAVDMQPEFIAPQGDCQALAMSFVQMQKWQGLYETEHGFTRGTIFTELDLPFMGKGACRNE